MVMRHGAAGCSAARLQAGGRYCNRQARAGVHECAAEDDEVGWFVWSVMCDVRCVMCGVWCVVCDVWCVVCGV